MNKRKTNMYIEDGQEVPTWNPLLGGPCEHKCSYCYVPDMIKNKPLLREYYSGEPRLNPNAFKKDPKKLKKQNKGKGPVMIFVGNMSDVFADNVPTECICEILAQCNKFPENTYLLQSKNPMRMFQFWEQLPPKTVLATTIESDDEDLVEEYSDAPLISDRVAGMRVLSENAEKDKRSIETMVTMEPIMDFSPLKLAGMVMVMSPDKVYVGADSKLVCHNCGYGKGEHDDYRWRGKKTCSKCGSDQIGSANGLPEPSRRKVEELLELLNEITEVRIKPNLERIIG